MSERYFCDYPKCGNQILDRSKQIKIESSQLNYLGEFCKPHYEVVLSLIRKELDVKR